MSARSLPARFVDEAAALVKQRTGLVVGASRRVAFESALAEAMGGAGAADPVVYLADLAATPALMDDLGGRITVGETYFFRDPDQFALIEREILPSLLGSRPPDSGPLRLWSAGCATGEEPYTLAILAARLGIAGRSRILGTDLSRSALSRARRAQYTRWSLRGVPGEVVDELFRRSRDRFVLAPALRGAVEFRYLNLADATYPSAASGIADFDLVLCRNVLIYFDGETIRAVAERLLGALAPGGWLLLGASDPLIGDLVRCEAVVTRAGLAYRRAAAAAVARPPHAVEALERGAVGSGPVAALPVPAAPVRAAAEVEAIVARGTAAVPSSDEAARCYAERDYERAALLAERAVARDAADPAPRVVLVRALANCGDLAAAERACAAALERHAMRAELHCLHAFLLNSARQHQAGLVAARRALYLDHGLAMAHLAHGAALAGSGDVRNARRAFFAAARLLERLPPDAVVPASDGERADALAALARAELELLAEAAA